MKRSFKKALTSLLLVPAFVLPSLGQADGTPKKSENATGTIQLDAGDWDFPAFAKVSFIRAVDTTVYRGDVSGRVNYSLETNSPTKYKLIVEQGKETMYDPEGDKFEKFESEMTVYPGKNERRIISPK